MSLKRFHILLLSAVMIILITGCVPGDGSCSSDDPAGFFPVFGTNGPLFISVGFFHS